MSKGIDKKIDDALFNFYMEADKATIRELLAEELDIEAYDKKKKKLLFMLKADANKRKNESLLKAAEQLQQAIQKGVEKPIAILKQIIQKNPSLALYSKLDKLSKEDIIEIIKDSNLIDVLNQLDDKE
jgi:hypothetical protein